MNALDRLFVNARRGAMAARLLGCAAMAASLSGCLTNPFTDAKVDPGSPIAAEVAKAATANRDYPSFAEIPATPADLRPARMYGTQAHAVDVAAAQLDRATAPGTWQLKNTDAFAAGAQAEAGPDLPAAAADTEAFASSIRKRATPPPPAKR